MSSNAPKLEWLIAESEAAWEGIQQQRAASDAKPHILRPAWYKRRHLISAWGLALILLVNTGYHQWRNARAEHQQIYAEVQAVEDEQTRLINQESRKMSKHLIDPQVAPAWRSYFSFEWMLTYLSQQGGNTVTDSTVQQMSVHGDKVLVQVLTSVRGADGVTHALRATHFYRRTAAGWQRTTPDRYFWGAPETLATDHFHIQFYTRDAPAVLAVAGRVDELYRILRRNLGLPPPTQAKVTIVVAADTPPQANMFLTYKGGTLVVPTPTLQPVPASLTEAEILTQSIVLLLGEKVLEEWFATANLHDKHLNSTQLQFALRLWQLWAFDGPLATGRYNIVHELYADRHRETRDLSRQRPTNYSQICLTYRAWHLAPALLLPVTCSDHDPAFWYSQVALLHLKSLAQSTTLDPQWPDMPNTHGKVIALTTLIEYIVANYGQEQLPQFLAAFGKYETWEALIPAVFACSITEFEAGWHQYLVDQYAVTLP